MKINPELIQKLLNSHEWLEAAKVFDEMRLKWTASLRNFSTSTSMEQIALDRVKWTAMITGVQTFVIELNRIADEFQELEQQRKESKNARPANSRQARR